MDVSRSFWPGFFCLAADDYIHLDDPILALILFRFVQGRVGAGHTALNNGAGYYAAKEWGGLGLLQFV